MESAQRNGICSPCELYGITQSVHLRRLDSMRGFVAIPYRNKLRIPSTALP